ncbi:MAG: hypothetical protein FWE82_08970 [Defluviitaleaceae bacterium]|nr:hypothetical protein [Defluviitaleaceae bacterium]
MEKYLFESYKPLPKWIWNCDVESITEEEVRRQFAGFRDKDNYGGVMIVPWRNSRYMDEVYFEKYGYALKAARDFGMEIIIWDENGFPSGSAGGIIAEKYPAHRAKYLCMESFDTNGLNDVPAFENGLVAYVALNLDSYVCVNLNGNENKLQPGKWRIMKFYLNESKKTLVDYLCPDAVDAFIACTHDAYYARFKEYFGNVIKYAFYDEPALYQIENGLAWTARFNEFFRLKNGYDPSALYPALFMDVGPDTGKARHALLNLRAELYADNYVKRLNDWCENHGVILTGHMDQEEIANPTHICGDLIKVMGRQHVPGVDEVFQLRRASRAYKLASSSAYNYDKPAVMCEVFGAMGAEMPLDWLWRESMDEMAKGVNFFVPHGTWYDNVNNVIFPPELSFRTERFAEETAAVNQYTERTCKYLRGGRHVCDIAVLYPIDDMQAHTWFDGGDSYMGSPMPPHANYLEIGEQLSLKIRKDFIYLHPEVFMANCRIEKNKLVMENKINREEFFILIVPAMKYIGAATLCKIYEFVKSGGTVISFGEMPSMSVEFGCDGEIKKHVDLLNAAGFAGCFKHIPSADFISLSKFLSSNVKDICIDVIIEQNIEIENGDFSYIHKNLNGNEIFFFANSSDTNVSTAVSIRGEHDLRGYDPHTDTVFEINTQKKEGRTVFQLDLPPVKSVFFMCSV